MEDKVNNQVRLIAAEDPCRPGVELDRSAGLPKIILASTSPRRAEILRAVGWPFEARPPEVDETRAEGEDATTYVQRLGRAKAEAIRSSGHSTVGADTVVVVDEMILGKPRDDEDAREMLRQLSGRWHEVLTGLAFIDGVTAEVRVACETTEVQFASMSKAEIDWYVSSGEPMDKAGAYAIQGLGARFIRGIRGDYYNVVGLPVRLLYELAVGPSATVKGGQSRQSGR
jgi:septum formation protein